MQFLNQLLQLLQQGLAAIFRFIGLIWRWTITQVGAVPWDALNELSPIKVVLLIIMAAVVIYLLYRAGRELLDAGEKLLNAFVTLLTVFVRTLPYILIAGVVAAGGSWLINHVNI
jgi:Ca2+/Na+ antiporter